MSEVQFPLEFRLYGNLGQFCAVMEDQIKIFLLAPREKMLIGQGSWEILLYEIVFSPSFPLSGNCRDIKHKTQFVF